MAISEIVNYDEGFTLELKDPRGNDIGVLFKVRSSECDEAKAVIRRMLNKRAAAQAKNKPYSVEEAERDEIERVAACIVDWEWGEQEYIRGEGAPEFTKKNVVEILTKEGWIFSQVHEFISDIENFTKK